MHACGVLCSEARLAAVSTWTMCVAYSVLVLVINVRDDDTQCFSCTGFVTSGLELWQGHECAEKYFRY